MKKIFVCFVSILLIAVTLFNVSKANVEALEIFNDFSAKSYVVTDGNGEILFGKDYDEKREVASICKLMTTLITLENIENGNLSLDDKFFASENACSIHGSQAFLDAGSEYTIRDLLKSVIVASANDSALVLAEGIGGNESNFVQMMNDRAEELGMLNTKYSNSTGLNGGNQYSTARDTTIILREVSKYPLYVEDCSIWMDNFTHPSGRVTELVNTNRLIKYYSNCTSGKTGYTDEAGYCLSSIANKDNLKIVCVVLGCDTSANRFKESIELYNYAYANFINDLVICHSEYIENNIQVLGSSIDKLDIVAKNDYYLTQNKNEKKDYEIKYELPKSIKAPLVKGDIVGRAFVIIDNEVISTIDLVADNDLPKQKYGNILEKIIDNFGIFN